MINKNELQNQSDINFSEEGLIYSDSRRAILVSTSSYIKLRKHLYRNLGEERAKGILIRHGSEIGSEDARTILKKDELESIESIIKKGPIYHHLHGHVIPTITLINVEQHDEKVSTYIEGRWDYSYEAEEHIKQFGLADKAVCFTSVGYGNGYLTEICNQQVLFKEITCVAKGDKTCKWVARTIDYWSDEMNDELKYYEENPIVKELELTYEMLLTERNNLKNVSVFYNKLTEEILKERELQGIMETVYDLIKTPILIENIDLKPLASGGLSKEELTEFNQTFLETKKRSFQKTQIVRFNNHTRLISPIYLQGKVIGFCSFIYKNVEKENSYSQLIIERIASACALYLLNKKTEIEAEERMKGRFLEQILSEDYSKDELLKKGNFIGLDFFQPYYITAVNYTISNRDYKDELSFLDELMNQSRTYFKKLEINILMGQQSNNMVLLFLRNEIEEKGIQSTCSSYLNFLTKSYPSVSFRVGVSTESDDIENASVSYSEALASMRMAKKGNSLVSFDSLGILGSLINTNNKDEIERTARRAFGTLSDELYDEKNLELIKTLYIYLLRGGNLEQTASELALSLSGLRYRIAKIEEVLEQDLRNPEVTYKLLLSLQALISIGKLELDKN